VEIAEFLGASARTVRRLAEVDPDPTIVRAIRLQMGLREAVRARNPFDLGSGRIGKFAMVDAVTMGLLVVQVRKSIGTRLQGKVPPYCLLKLDPELGMR
jgi:hypothetical protein